ncbi:MAG: UDP-2,3-diacylglucosamine diphosphatase [Gemmatimonadota bacterium]|nr:MAG: UDP-2,3-diacylglucosamine diphosphatase [Gemmatimonadota bacterium]
MIISDLHLGALPGVVHEEFRRFARSWQGRADILLINGDLFDFWCEYRTVFPTVHFHTLRLLADLRESGVRIILVGGNHDAWGGAFLANVIGIELADGPIELELAGRRGLVAHGDGVGPGDWGYKMLKFVLRSRPVCAAMRWVHPDIACRIARGVSQTEKRTQRSFAKAEERAQILEDYAVRLLKEREDLDLVVFGHCHVPQVKTVGSHGFYINSGDWVTHRTYTVVTEDSIEQREWAGSES